VTDTELTRALERRQIPNEGFHHVDHLRVAFVYLTECGTVDEALGRMETTLRAFAASVGKPEKYSQSMTEFWMYQMAAARALLAEADCAMLLRACPKLLDKNFTLASEPALEARTRR